MEHLTDEQLEEALRGEDTDFEHLRKCRHCRDRLAQKRAISQRLRSAFACVHVGSDVGERIRQKLLSRAACRVPRAVERGPMGSLRRTQHAERSTRQFRWAFAAAAAILIVLVPLSLYFGTPSESHAAQAALVGIHRDNLGPDREFFSDSEPEKLAQYFKSELGFSPALPCTGQGLAIRGCCVAHFRERIVGSYVVDTPQGVISVIVVTDTPESMGMARMAESARTGQVCWKASFARCSMVTVRLGDYSYCAVGEISHKYLLEFISRLLS